MKELRCLEESSRSSSAPLVVQEARKRQVIVSPLDAYYASAPDRCGLLLGYGGLEIADIVRGTTILAEVIQHVAAR